jgi:hypothetical protein
MHFSKLMPFVTHRSPGDIVADPGTPAHASRNDPSQKISSAVRVRHHNRECRKKDRSPLHTHLPTKS